MVPQGGLLAPKQSWFGPGEEAEQSGMPRSFSARGFPSPIIAASSAGVAGRGDGNGVRAASGDGVELALSEAVGAGLRAGPSVGLGLGVR